MTTTAPGPVIDALLIEARPRILVDYHRNSCIASTRIVIDVLKEFGIKARPFPCRVMAWNSVYTRRFEQGLRPLDDPEAYSVGIGYFDAHWKNTEAVEPLWMHLAAVTETGWLVDVSLDQASRPERGIVLQPWALPVQDGLLEGKPTVYSFSGGGCLVYHRCTDHGDYRVGKGWGRESPNREIADDVIRAVRLRVGRAAESGAA